MVRLDEEWQNWGFPELLENLRRWTERNPISQDDRGTSINFSEFNPARQPKREKVFQTRQQEGRKRACVYCESNEHISTDCDTVTEVAERKDHLRKKRLCFNCTGASHRAAECRVKTNCKICSSRHHTSVCDKKDKKPEQVLLATGEQGIIYPVVLVKVNGITCRALLDTGAGSSYISAKLIELIGKKPASTQVRQIDMMMCTTTKRIEVYNVEVKNTKGDFGLKVDVNKVEKEVLLTVSNPQYKQILAKYSHLRGITMADQDQKAELPIHLIIGASEYAKIKTENKPRIGKPGEPVGELTRLGWALISPGAEIDGSKMFFAKSSLADYDKLCSLNVLSLRNSEGNESSVYSEFKEQLNQSPDGFYETGLIWKNTKQELPDNKDGSRARLNKLLQKLQQQPELFEQYDQIMRDQQENGIIEEAEKEPVGKVFYLPHKPVVRKMAETTKVRIVYDASAKATTNAPSLNDCLETGPSLQNLIWDILVRNRTRPVTLAGDLKQTFLQC